MDGGTTRERAIEATFKAFYRKPFEWGLYDCIRLCAYNLKQLGYNPNLTRGGFYSSELGAARALLRIGCRSTEEAVDDVVGTGSRIDPRDALPADIIGFTHGMAMSALTVCIGGGRVLGFMEEACHVIVPNLSLPDVTYVAWRCEPRR